MIHFHRITWVSLLGDSSYSLYLSHFFTLSAVAQMLFHRGRPNIVVFFSISLAAALVGGVACWVFIERPLTKAFRDIALRRRLRLALASESSSA